MGFADELLRLSNRAREGFREFVSFLKETENPYTPELEGKCVTREDGTSESPLGDGFYLLWKVHSKPVHHSVFQFEADEVLLLGFGYRRQLILIPSEGFADEFLQLSCCAQREFEAFTSLLKGTENPYAPELQKKTVDCGNEVLEYPLGDGFYLLWKVHSKPVHHSVFRFEKEDEIFLLGFEHRAISTRG